MLSIVIYSGVLFVVTVSFVICCVPRLVKPRKQSSAFLFEGNGPILAAASNAGALFTAQLFLVVAVGGAFIYGLFMYLLALPIIGCGCILLIILYRKTSHFFAHKNSENEGNGVTTILNYISEKIGAKTGHMVSAMWLTLVLITLMIELTLVRMIFNRLIPSDLVSYEFFFIFLVVVCCLYTVIGGYDGILKTDLFQTSVILGATVYLGIHIITRVGFEQIISIAILTRDMKPLSIMVLLPICILSISMIVSSCDTWIRNTSTLHSTGATNFAVITGCVILALVVTVPFGIGLWARTLVDFSTLETSGFAYFLSIELFETILANLRLSAVGYFLVFAVITAIAITTIDTLLITVSQIIFDRRLSVSEGSLKEFLQINPRILIFITIALVTIISVIVPKSSLEFVCVFMGVLFLTLAPPIASAVLCPHWFGDDEWLLIIVCTLILSVMIAIFADLKFTVHRGRLVDASAGFIAIVVWACMAVSALVVKLCSLTIGRLCESTKQ